MENILRLSGSCGAGTEGWGVRKCSKVRLKCSADSKRPLLTAKGPNNKEIAFSGSLTTRAIAYIVSLWILCSRLNKESVISSSPADQLALSFWVLPRLQLEHADLPSLDVLLKFPLWLCPRLLLRLNPTKTISCSSTGKPSLKLSNDSLRFSWVQMIEHCRRNNYRRSSGWKCLDRSSMEWRFCRHQVIDLVTSYPPLFLDALASLKTMFKIK